MHIVPTVLTALRRFLPGFLHSRPPLSSHQHRAIWAITRCRTPALGGDTFACERCGHVHFAWHSCNHKACPQCGRAAIQAWIQHQLDHRLRVPYFLVTFTLPAELRGQFFGPHAKTAFDLFFTAVSGALKEKLAQLLGFHVSGFTLVLQTWNQRLQFHPHLHVLLPGAGLDQHDQLVQVQQPDFLLHLPLLRAAFRQHFHQRLKDHDWPVDPSVWSRDWGVHIQPVGSGVAAIKYLGHYVARTAIDDSRVVAITDDTVTFRWKDRSDQGRTKTMALPANEFVSRYLRHVLPQGLRSIRYYGFCHPSAKAKRLRLQLLTAHLVDLGATPGDRLPKTTEPYLPACPKCGGPCRLVERFGPAHQQRGPPAPDQDPQTWLPLLPLEAA